MSINLTKTTYPLYYASQIDPGKEGTTKGGYLEGAISLPANWSPGTRLTISLSCVPGDDLSWEHQPGGFPCLSSGTSDASEEFHPCVPHLVYLEKGKSGTKLWRNRHQEYRTWFDNFANFARTKELSVCKIEDGVIDQATGCKVAELVNNGDQSWSIKLGQGENGHQKLNINLLIPKTKKTVVGHKSEPDEMLTIIVKEFKGEGDVIKESKVNQIHQHYQSDNCENLKRLRIKVAFRFLDYPNLNFSIKSSVIQDKLSIVEINKPNILKCCSKGGRTIILTSKVHDSSV